MKKWGNIIIHCSDSDWGCVREIRDWHLQRGWRDIGYHFVIMNGKPVSNLYMLSLNGAIECGRYLDGDDFVSDNEVGAHALGYNSDSIGICLVGKKVFTPQQIGSLHTLIHDLQTRFGIKKENVLGHCETERSGGKTCPNFDVASIRNLLW